MAQLTAQGLVHSQHSGSSIDSDLPIVARITRRDQHALVELYGRYRQPLFSYLRSLTRDDQLAEEILQDTMLAVWTSAHRFRGQSSVRGWLYGIARRQAHNAFRRAPSPVPNEPALRDFPSTEPRPEDFALVKDGFDELVAAIRKLSPVLSETLMLVAVHELSYEETGRVLRVPIGTVKSRLNKARHVLRPLLDTAGGELK